MRTIDRRPWPRLRRRRRTDKPQALTVELRDVTYVDDDGHRVLDGADLLVPPGSMVCLMGSTERDQATVAGLLLGLHRPGRGAVEVGGHSLLARSLADRRTRVAGVLQDPWMIDGTIADNISFDLPGVTRADVEAAARTIGIDRLIAAVPGGYGGSVADLTLGQRRAVALARAVAREPGVLVLEEPTTDLEPDEEREMIRAITAAARDRTTIVLTHRLSLARRADTVMVVDDGRVVPYRGNGPDGGHAKLWDTRVPPVRNQHGGRHLRLVGDHRPAAQPTGGSWSITIGDEFIPGYLASGLLSRSSDTETWVAWSIRGEQPVRIKVPRIRTDAPPLDDPVTYRAWEQLTREHRVLKGIDHPGVTRVLDVDLEAEMPYLVLEYLDSTSLARVLQRQPDGLTPLDALQVGFELAGTLEHLHQRGQVHLNLRTGHVRTRDEVVVITDFTQCRPIGSELPRPVEPARGGRVDGRLFAPEFRPGRRADPTMDIYALGSLIHRATAGSVTAGLTAGRGGPPAYSTLARQVPAGMADVVDHMLAPNPGDRPNAGEVISHFRHILPSTLVKPRVSLVQTRSTLLHLVSPTN
jgi:energy-coupling factor transporter ATP-binding protein EcfA2